MAASRGSGATVRASRAAGRTAAERTSGAAPEGRRARNKRDKLGRITRAASELFREQGFDETTARAICERAGIATGTLFLYVRDKRELLLLLFRPLAERAFARLPVGLRDGEQLVDGLVHLFGAFFRIYARDPLLARVFVQELFFRSDQGAEMRALSRELEARVARIVDDARARGALRTDVPARRQTAALLAHYAMWIQLWLGTGVASRRAAERGLRDALVLQVEGLAP
ncbi:MAG: TetR/AcrR family transcriptional regulator [Myxococcales bacterium]|nr:TetR/AcrR family transcriptional regulator [Myxococcales bacterium]